MTSLGWFIIVASMVCGIVAGVVTVVQNRSDKAILTSIIGTAVVVFFVLYFLLS